ncbi:hypothetical protein FVI12_21595 [Escherichia coli]|nr:hypothetical protein [Escherichia coli]
MRDDFCAFILTHGRPDKVLTYRTLRRAGYTGKIFIVVDDEDKTRKRRCTRTYCRYWCSYALRCDWFTWTYHHR